MLDVGTELETNRTQTVREMKHTRPEEWKDESLRLIKENMEVSTSGVPLKYIYGSDFPYRSTDLLNPLTPDHTDTASSLGLGGFSSVWGAAILPYHQRDLSGWPITSDDLAPHYKAITSFISLSAGKDLLQSQFPIFKDNPNALNASKQALEFLDDFEKEKTALTCQGIFAGRSRLAVNSHKCIYCGLCMYGCPRELIYSSAFTLRRLKNNPRFIYRKNFWVRKLRERPGKIEVIGHEYDPDSPHLVFFGEDIVIPARRAFLAAGTLATTRIILESLQAYDHTLKLLDSRYYLFPLLRYRKISGVERENLHTLSQLFLELVDPALGRNTIHLQIYSYNELYRQALRSMLGPLFSIARIPVRALLERMLIAQGYLHSDYSPSINVSLSKGEKNRPGKLSLHVPQDERSNGNQIIQNLMRKLYDNRSLLRGIPLSPLLKMTAPGRGFHSGGVLPMRSRPGDFECDVLGRPSGFSRLHVVDSTVFPSIPATTITFTVMANAHRIAISSLKGGKKGMESPVKSKSKQRNRKVTCGVTGSKGYVGSIIAAALQKENFDVIHLIRPSPERTRTTKVRFFQLGEEPDPSLFQGIDVLIHCAYDFMASGREDVYRVNVHGTIRLFNAARNAGVKKIIYISTMSAFPGCRSVYGQAKMMVEAEAARHNAIIVRPGLVYGPSPGGMVGALNGALKLPILPLVGMGHQMLYLIHENDLGAMIGRMVLESDIPFGIPFIAANEWGFTFREILKILAAHRGRRVFFIPIPWFFLWLPLKVFEMLGLRIRLRSDSLISLINQERYPDFGPIKRFAFKFRKFEGNAVERK